MLLASPLLCLSWPAGYDSRGGYGGYDQRGGYGGGYDQRGGYGGEYAAGGGAAAAGAPQYAAAPGAGEQATSTPHPPLPAAVACALHCAWSAAGLGTWVLNACCAYI